MKVGIYLGQQAPDVGGGYTFQEEILRSFLQGASASKHNFCVICNEQHVRHYEGLASGAANVKVAGLPKATLLERIKNRLKISSSFAREQFKAPNPLDRLASRYGIDLIWCLSAGPVLVEIPYITVVWDLQHRLQPWFPEVSAEGQWDFRESSYSWFLRRATAVIAGNDAGKQEIHSFYQVPCERIRLLPHPTPQFALDSFSSPRSGRNIRAKYGIAGDYVFYPAQFWAHKNHVNLLYAIQYLRNRRGIELEVVLSGSDKGNRRHVEKVARELDLAEAVRFLGFVPQEDLVDLYRHAVALTYVSFFGPENLPPLEAFALGCPVVASKVSGSEEQLGGAARLVDPRKPEEIADAIEVVYRDKRLRKELIDAGRIRAESWRTGDFVRGVFGILDEFENVRRCWA